MPEVEYAGYMLRFVVTPDGKPREIARSLPKSRGGSFIPDEVFTRLWLRAVKKSQEVYRNRRRRDRTTDRRHRADRSNPDNWEREVPYRRVVVGNPNKEE